LNKKHLDLSKLAQSSPMATRQIKLQNKIIKK